MKNSVLTQTNRTKKKKVKQTVNGSASKASTTKSYHFKIDNQVLKALNKMMADINGETEEVIKKTDVLNPLIDALTKSGVDFTGAETKEDVARIIRSCFN